jgi:hypothetical protein
MSNEKMLPEHTCSKQPGLKCRRCDFEALLRFPGFGGPSENEVMLAIDRRLAALLYFALEPDFSNWPEPASYPEQFLITIDAETGKRLRRELACALLVAPDPTEQEQQAIADFQKKFKTP